MKGREGVTLFLDLDGPILDVSKRYFRVHRDILAELRCRDRAGDKASYWRIKRNGRPLSALLAGRRECLVDEGAYRRLWLDRIESSEYLGLDSVIPGAREQLARLRGSYALVLVTLRQNRQGLEEQLRRLQLRSFFRAVLCTRPLVEGSWRAKRRLIRSSPFFGRSSWIVGDSEVDILAGKSLGLTTVAVLSGIRNLSSLKHANPDFIIPGIRCLSRVLSTAAGRGPEPDLA